MSPAITLDTELMLRVKAGEADCMEPMLERHRAPVVRFLFRMVQNQAVAEELAQDTFLRVYRSRASYQPSAKFTTWLFRIATHLALNWIRDSRHEREHDRLDTPTPRGMERQIADRSMTVDEMIIREARAREIRAVIAELPGRQRAVVLMHKYEGMEYTQIAGALNCSPQAVKSLLFRAYTTLRSRLAHMA